MEFQVSSAWSFRSFPTTSCSLSHPLCFPALDIVHCIVQQVGHLLACRQPGFHLYHPIWSMEHHQELSAETGVAPSHPGVKIPNTITSWKEEPIIKKPSNSERDKWGKGGWDVKGRKREEQKGKTCGERTRRDRILEMMLCHPKQREEKDLSRGDNGRKEMLTSKLRCKKEFKVSHKAVGKGERGDEGPGKDLPGSGRKQIQQTPGTAFSSLHIISFSSCGCSFRGDKEDSPTCHLLP